MKYDYNPKLLGQVSSVEIVSLYELDIDRVSQYMQNAQNAPFVTAHGSAATEIAELWRGLTPGHQSRCHFPSYGLRFRLHDSSTLEASICWECSNMYGLEHNEPFHYEFDNLTPSAKKLLTRLKQILPLESL